MDLLKCNVDVDAITQGSVLLKRWNADNYLTEVSIVSNRKDIPQSTGSVKYEAVPLDEFIGTNIKDWDGHSPLTLFFNRDGTLDHYDKTGMATAGAAT